MKFRPIFVDNTGQELTEHGTDDFPMSMDKQLVSQEHCANVPHWHYEVQIAVVTEGSVMFETPLGSFFVEKGEGIFINSGCPHEIKQTDDENSVYVCVNFNPKMISEGTNSLIRRYYVDPLLTSNDMEVIHLNSTPWHKEICGLLLRMAEIDEAQSYGYEIELKALLCKIWLRLLTNNRGIIENSAPVTFADKQRIRALRQYIHKNYMERISLSDISSAVHISKGECCRIFSRIMHTTPFRYLINYRIAQSLKMLSTTNMSIAEIAQQNGFGSSSYYTECFRKEMNCRPMEYRRHAADSRIRQEKLTTKV
ncbi:MAG: AraC family transcriptional regulator [Synergistaceae bacterium]|nr:AraC family transcriptional regulator [Synergistaceae bacterium]